ncbi:MAG: methylenetetrahydrofolate reductase [Candidatus Altiarchaeota archaeon]|nr:methylenetetrahydrofolate reductase [Candidatus Altiarchaeota archaeon]
MTLRRELKKKFTYTGELEPGKISELKEIVEEARKLKKYVTACNVTDNPQAYAYISSLAASYMIQEKAGMEAIYQLTCRDRNRLALTSELLGAAALGIKNVLALTGDYTTLGDMPEAKPVFDLDACRLVHMIKEMNEGRDIKGNRIEPRTEFFIGVAANPNAIPLEPEILKLEKKEKVGAEFVQTQVVYEMEIVENFLEATKNVEIPILIGVFPLRSYGVAEYFDKNVPGVKVPEKLLKELKEIKEAGGAREEYDKVNERFFSGLIKGIKKTDARGCHIMAVNYSEIVEKLVV